MSGHGNSHSRRQSRGPPNPSRTSYCPTNNQFVNGYQHEQMPRQQPQQLPQFTNGESEPRSVQELWSFVQHLQNELSINRGEHAKLLDDFVELRHVNSNLMKVVDRQADAISKLEVDLDNLDQYSRRENVCFTNLLVNEEKSCEDQVVLLCEQLGVDIAKNDLVAAHPLKGKKGKAPRFIARFKDRSTAQKVFRNRKETKNISPDKKKLLFENPEKGVGVQPNITSKRAALLGQVNDAVRLGNLSSCWVDYKNGNVLLRVNANGNPKLIRNTADLLVCVPTFKPNEFLFCESPFLNNTDSGFSP